MYGFRKQKIRTWERNLTRVSAGYINNNTPGWRRRTSWVNWSKWPSIWMPFAEVSLRDENQKKKEEEENVEGLAKQAYLLRCPFEFSKRAYVTFVPCASGPTIILPFSVDLRVQVKLMKQFIRHWIDWLITLATWVQIGIGISLSLSFIPCRFADNDDFFYP